MLRVAQFCISGSKGRDGRPGLDQMLNDAQRRRFDVVMAWAIDRLHSCGIQRTDDSFFFGPVKAKKGGTRAGCLGLDRRNVPLRLKFHGFFAPLLSPLDCGRSFTDRRGRRLMGRLAERWDGLARQCRDYSILWLLRLLLSILRGCGYYRGLWLRHEL
jgi:hypothetical protein